MARSPAREPSPPEPPPGASEAWVRRLQEDPQGASTAWGRVHGRYQQRLLALAWVALGPHLRRHCDPEDLVNEAWARVLPRLGDFEYRGPESLFRWLCQQVHRAAADQARRFERKAGRETPVGEDAPDAPAPGAGPRTEVERADTWRRLAASLERVPEAYRRVLTACLLEGLSVKETAARLGLKPDTVRKQRLRGLKAWRRALGSDPLAHL